MWKEMNVWMLIPAIIAVVLHEVAHGWMAVRLGDPTAGMMGRLSLKPWRHVDVLGTIVVPLVTLYLVSFPMGWAKSVPVNPFSFRDPKRDMAWVAFAGPFCNMLQAILWVAISVTLITTGRELGYDVRHDPILHTIVFASVFGILINVALAAFNLLPIPPLDGGRIAVALLPLEWSQRLQRVEKFGPIIVALLIIVASRLWQ